MSKTLRVTPDEIDALARIAAREAGNQPAEGVMGVVATVLNRVASGRFGQDIISTIEERGQFEPMLGKSSYTELPPAPANIHNQVQTYLMAMANGDAADPTGGATFFQNPKITKARGTNFAKAPPTTTIGDHAFYNRYGNNDPVEVPSYTVAFAGRDLAPDPLPAQTQLIDERAPSLDPADIAVRSLRPSADPAGGGRISIANAFVSGVAQADKEKRDAYLATVLPNDPLAAFDPTVQDKIGGFENPTSAKNPYVPPTQGEYGLVASGDHVDLSGLDPSIAAAANRAASIFGRNLTATSGFRSAGKQAALKAAAGANNPRVANKSHHTSGSALDLSIRDMSEAEQAALVDALVQSGFTGFGFYDTHMHADFRDTVPKSFGNNANWGGWTTIPDSAWNVLQRRGFGANRSASEVYRGPWQ